MTVGRHGRTAIVVGLLGLVNACASRPREGPRLQEHPWPAYLGSSSRVGTAETLATDPQPVWRASPARGIMGAPALTEDIVAVGLADHRVVLLERATGAQIWTRRLTLAIGAGPLVSDDRIFVAEQTRGGRVYAITLRWGATIWSARAGDVSAPLALSESGLYIGTMEGVVGKIDPTTGVYKWRTRLPGAVRTALTPVADGVVVTTAMDSIYLLDAVNGTVRARRATRGAVLAAPAAQDSVIITGTMSGRLEALSASTLRSIWTVDAHEPIVGSIAIQGGKAYALTGRGTLLIVNVGDTAAVRRIPLGVVSRAGPTPSAQGVYVSTVDGEIILVDSTGTRKWSARIEAPIVEPVVADGRMLIAVSQRGDVIAYR